MKKFAKKLCSIILVLCVIFSAIFVLPVSAAVNGITLGVPLNVHLTEGENYDVSFTPDESCAYVFYSDATTDTYGCILDSEGNQLVDDYGYRGNFFVVYDLVAGETYTLRARFRSSTNSGSFNIALSKLDVVALSVDDVSVTENNDGRWQEFYDEELGQNVSYWKYDYNRNISIVLADGTTIKLDDNDGFVYNNNLYVIYDSYGSFNNAYYANWQPNNTYAVRAYIGNHYPVDAPVPDFFDVECTYNVTVNPSPIKSITVEPVNVIENSNGYWSKYWDDELQQELEYYCYNYWYNNVKATIEFNDGTTQEAYLNSGIYYGGQYYYFSQSTNQGLEEWTVGNTYTATVSLLGKTVEVPVTIVESPVKSIAIEPVNVIENSNGYWTTGWDNELQQEFEYYYYSSWHSNVKATVEFNDGTIEETYLGRGVDYGDVYYGFSINTSQGGLQPWTIGNTYTATVSLLGKTVEVPVTIVESPVKSITVEPISFIEGTGGYWSDRWDSELQQYVEFYRYQWQSNPVTIEFNDGSTITTSIWSDFEYNGQIYSLNYYDTQYNNPWTAGNTYTVNVSCMGKSVDVPITITESPLESLEIISVDSIKENSYYWIDGNGNKQYSMPNFTYKINFKDGTSSTREYNRYYEDYSIYTSYDQYNNPWTVGGDNLVTVSLGKLTATFSVEILEVKDWEYTEQDGNLYITGCNLRDYEITIPSEIDGKSVVGIMDFGDATNRAGIVNIPDSVTFISNEAFQSNYSIHTINIGDGLQNLDADMFVYCNYLRQFNVSPTNPNYCSIDGIIYNKAGDTLVVYPIGRHETYNIPDSVVNVDVLFNKPYYSDVYYKFTENSQAFVEEDGVTYNKDKTVIIKCDPAKTGSYVMPDSVTTINSYAFSGSALSEVEVSDNVSELVYNSFSYCQNLETIKLPDSITSIGQAAFYNSDLKNLTTLPDSVENIGSSAFAYTELQSMLIPSSVKEIGSNAFANSTLSEVTLSEGLVSIGGGAFYGTNIKSVTIPDSVTELGGCAFENTPISKITLGSGLESIPYGAFIDCYELKEVTLPQNITYIDDCAFCDAAVSKVTFKAPEVFIGNRAFYGCPLDKTTFGNNIAGFGSYAFAYSGMTSVKIPDSVTDITYYSFAYSADLKNIDIPDNLTHVDGHAFDGTAWYEAQPEGVVYLENVLYHYKGDIIEDTDIVVKDGTTIIADYAFEKEVGSWWNDYETIREVSGLKSVTLPDSVKVIGDFAFYSCEGLEKIVIPESVETIGWGAFSGCYNLTIYGVAGSYAQEYALVHHIPFAEIVEKQTQDVKVSATTDVIDSNAQLVVDSVATDDIADKFEDATNIKAFDIYFELNGKVVAPNGSVNVEISIPDEFDGRYCTVYHVADDGTVTDMQATRKDGKLVFTTNHFSVYVIVENKPDFEAGDINGDSDINNKDLGILMQYLNGWPVEIVEEAADVNDDGDVNNKDYGLLMQYINGWPVELK